ncbi:hypothetical protein [Paenibacillus alginolyticus]|uniref:Uncharacterized protein n=1 Tax=Paenibacillus alginolyticus TaxID=59839 RepID=A0ABT4GEZ9_9BACL|nr:hypothetical protein [Paenibacillus alginolyticus]MCY9694766.1 hypothetical protein [Paenibacillus alginolyticus]MEC0147062.1 hypothetical protein [Paenibacillus alginolyticus]
MKIEIWIRKNIKLIGTAVLILSVALFFYNVFQGNTYKSKALKYINEYDSTQTYTYLDRSEEDCKMFQGCMVKVYVEGRKTGEEITVLFKDGNVVPMIPRNNGK